MNWWLLAVICAELVVGLLAGWYLGYRARDRKWR